MSGARATPPISWLGLALALAGPALVALGAERLPASWGPRRAKPLRTGGSRRAGGRRPRDPAARRARFSGVARRTPPPDRLGPWGLAAAAALVVVVVPVASAVVVLGLGGFGAGLDTVLAWPLWLRALAVLVGGTAEEILYRGYALTRLERATGSSALAAGLVVAIFALAHGPLWGPGPVVSFLFSGGFLTAFFAWRRDLLANVLAHVVVDALGLVLGLAAAE